MVTQTSWLGIILSLGGREDQVIQKCSTRRGNIPPAIKHSQQTVSGLKIGKTDKIIKKNGCRRNAKLKNVVTIILQADKNNFFVHIVFLNEKIYRQIYECVCFINIIYKLFLLLVCFIKYIIQTVSYSFQQEYINLEMETVCDLRTRSSNER